MFLLVQQIAVNTVHRYHQGNMAGIGLNLLSGFQFDLVIVITLEKLDAVIPVDLLEVDQFAI